MAGKRLASLLVAVPLILSLLAVPAGAAGAVGVTIDGDPGPLHRRLRRPLPGQRRPHPGPLPADVGDLRLHRLLGQPQPHRLGGEGRGAGGRPHRPALDDRQRPPGGPGHRRPDPGHPDLPPHPPGGGGLRGRRHLGRGVNRQVVVTTGAALVRVHFLDVGQGDAALIDCGTAPRSSSTAGTTAPGQDGGRPTWPPMWTDALDYVIATHPDADHIGGLDEVLAAYPVGEVIDSGRASDTKTYADYWAAVQAEGCTLSYDERPDPPPVGQHRPVPPGDRGRLGGQQRLLRGGPAHLRERPGPLHRGHDRRRWRRPPCPSSGTSTC